MEKDVMLISFGKPVTKRELERVKSQVPWERIGLYRNNVTTPTGSVFIFSNGSYRNSIRLDPVYNSALISGLDMILPIDYRPDDEKAQFSSLETIAENESEKLPPLTDTLFRVAQRFDRQLDVFPQEKIHLHTDKPYYIAGERIWFRAHVVDAATHVPLFSSNSVYVELFDARDSVVCRVKTGAANDLFSGYIFIPEDAPEGDYTLRAWTNRMRNSDEDYFFMKSIRIGDPMSRIIQTKPDFEFLIDQKIGAAIRFSRLFPSATITPETVKIGINGDKPMNMKSENGLSAFSFNLSPAERQRAMLLDLRYEKQPFRQYIRIPLPDDDFDVSFYPEGGSVLYGCRGRVAVKAIQRDGTEISVDGTVYDLQGNEITQFVTESRGMGQFDLMPERGETYYAVCTNSKGQSKRFDLPAPKENGYALSASWFRDRLILTYTRPNRKKRETRCV